MAVPFRKVAKSVSQFFNDFLLGLWLAGNVQVSRRHGSFQINPAMKPKSKGAFMRWYLAKMEREFWSSLRGDGKAARVIASQPLLPLFPSRPQLEFDFSRPYQKGGAL